MVWTVNLNSDPDLQTETAARLRRVDELNDSLNAADQLGTPRIVHFDKRDLPALSDRVVFHAPGDVVYCQRASDGELLWHTVLHLPEAFHVDADARPLEWDDTRRRAVADGQIAVFNGIDGLFAVGLVTGRRIWVQPREGGGDYGIDSRSDMAMAARDGLLAAMPKAGRLTLVRMLDGSTVWERDLRGEPVERLWMTDRRVVSADGLLQRVHLFRRTDGHLVRRVLFEQPDADAQLIDLICTSGVLCGPTSVSDSEGVTAVDLNSGETLWRTRLDKPLAQLFKPTEGYVGVGLLGGDVRILDAMTGDLVLKHRVSGARAVVDGVLIDGTLVVEHITMTGGRRYRDLAALDVATGEEVWRREDVVWLGQGAEPLQVVHGRVPVASHTAVRGTGRHKPVRVTMIDVRTGLGVGAEVTLPPGDGTVRLNGDFRILPGAEVAVIGMNKGIHALRIEPLVDTQSEEGGVNDNDGA